MNILITAGGTAEAIDQVRQLTNHATGRLGKEIAETLEKEEHTIYYIYGPQATLPTLKNSYLYPIRSVQQLSDTMEHLLTNKSIDVVIHSMAVSDYQLDHVTTDTELTEQLVASITQQNPQSETELRALVQAELRTSLSDAQQQKKISSSSEQLIIHLKKAPKVIGKIKHWRPDVLLIGFKLLVGVTDSDLLEAANKSIAANQADYIIANDLENITDTHHHALLINKNGVRERFSSKKEIAQGINRLLRSKKEDN